MNRVLVHLLGLFALPLVSIPLHAADWPMLGRDTSRNAVSPEKGAPTHWQISRRAGDGRLLPASNVRWQARLGSGNLSSPVVAGGLVWVGTNNTSPRDPKQAQDAAVLMCFRESDGQFLWQYVSPRLGIDHEDYSRSTISCSPLVEGDHLTFTTNRGEVVCLDVAPLRADKGEPRLLWKRDLRKDLGVRLFGYSMIGKITCSLAASYKGRLYVATGNGVGEDHRTVQAPNAPSLICLEEKSGKVLWADRSPGKDIMLAQWSSPLVAEVAGKGQVLHAQGDGWLRSFDALTGELLWKFDLNPKKVTPYKLGGGGQRCFPIATPVLYENRVHVAVGQDADDGSGVGHLWCIDITKTPKNPSKNLSPSGDDLDPKSPANRHSALVWHHGGMLPKPLEDGREWVFGRTMSNVAIHEGLVIAPELAGYVHCLDARTGKLHWVADVQSNVLASPLIADGKVYVPVDDGDVWVFALSSRLQILARNRVDLVRSGPVFANGTLYLATSSQLHAIRADGKAPTRTPGHWPQWRGPDRRNVSRETGLLKTWPVGGPPLVWRTRGLGNSPGSVAVTGGKVYSLGYVEGEERVTAIDEVDGKILWAARIGPAVKENLVMRWLAQRTPLVEDGRVYAVTANGELVCLATGDGKELWRKRYVQDFGGRRNTWGFCDHLLVDGDQLVAVPGGKKATVVALNRKTGEPIWTSPLGDDTHEYGATVLSTAGGIRHYVVVLRSGLAGVSARDGTLLWRYERIGKTTANGYSPIVVGDRIVCASGYGRGLALLGLRRSGKGLEVTEDYYKSMSLPPWHETTIEHEGHIYLGTSTKVVCLETRSGKVVWEDRGAVGGTFTVTCADGHLYLRDRTGKVALVEASPRGYRQKGLFQLSVAVNKAGSTAPVVAGGRLYLRDDDVLYCHDVTERTPPGKEPPGKKSPRERVPRAAFVPTPRDVASKMLALARVHKEDVVFDLGCGDGRIVVLAARKYGCQGRGFDIDPECVKQAREAARREGVSDRVRIEEEDLYKVDLQTATVVTLYLTSRMNQELVPRLKGLRAGTRVVAHAFPLPGIRPDRVETGTSAEGSKYTLYLYTTPLRPEAK